MHNDFLKMQYEVLRDEILATQRRDFQVIGIGLLVIPALNHFSPPWDGPLIFALPAVALVICLIHLANEQAILRCARYIRECIEPVLGFDAQELGHPVGWENFLMRTEDSRRWRSPDRYMRFGVNILLLAYLGVALWVAFAHALSRHMAVGLASEGIVHSLMWVLMGLYSLAAVAVVLHMFPSLLLRGDVEIVPTKPVEKEAAILVHVTPVMLQIKQHSGGVSPAPPTSDSANVVRPDVPSSVPRTGA